MELKTGLINILYGTTLEQWFQSSHKCSSNYTHTPVEDRCILQSSGSARDIESLNSIWDVCEAKLLS